LLLTCCIVGSATCFYIFDGLRAKGMDYGDALWFSLVSITTIGYGDMYPVSLGARLGTVIFTMLFGLATFTILFGIVVDVITSFFIKGQLGMGNVIAKDHVLLVNFPGVARVQQLVEELRSDPTHRNRDIVVVTDQIDRLPGPIEHVFFINGSPLQKDTYERARIGDARMALVLATAYDDPASDAVVASAVAVINSIKGSIYIVAECIDEKHRMLFDSVSCDAVVPGLRIAGNLLVQEIDDPGVAQMIDVITSNLRGTTIFSLKVEEELPQVSYQELAKACLDSDINLLSVNRGSETHTHFRSIELKKDDRLIYVAQKRIAWSDLVAMAKEI
jgi:voltage-gated potassium channel